MNLQPTDIIIRQSGGAESLWISQRLLMEVCEVSETYLWKSRSVYKSGVRACDLAKAKDFMPDSGKAWRWGKQSGQYYYCLNNIPNKAPKNYRSLFGDTEALKDKFKEACRSMEFTQLEERFKKHLKLVSRNYLEFYRDVNDIQRAALSKACAVLDFILDEKDGYPGTANKLYKDLSPILADMDLQYIPHNYLKLKEKITILETTDKSIVDIIQLPRTGNNNAEVYNDPEVFSWVMQMYANDYTYSQEHIIRKVTQMCRLTLKKEPSRRWYGQTIFEQPKMQFLTGAKRYGSGSRKAQIFQGYNPKMNALYAGDCWEMDATRVNMIAHYVEVVTIDKKTGKEKKKKVEVYPVIVAVRDVHSGDILGYSFGYSENHSVYLEAMKMAVQNAGYLPYEWVTDRFPGHNKPEMIDFFERATVQGVKFTISSHANRKARIERWFRTLQDVFYMDSKYFYGEGIQSRNKYAHRSADYLKRIKKEAAKEGWDFQKNIEEVVQHVENYRNTNLSTYSRTHKTIEHSPAELHHFSEKPNVTFVTEATISMLFGLRKKFTLKHNGQISTEIVGVEFHYAISPAYYDIISNYHGKEVIMTYDLNDLSLCYLWEKKGKLLKSLCEAELMEQAQTYGPDKNMRPIGIGEMREAAINELKEKELENMIGEDSLLMGRYTDKNKASAFENSYWDADENSSIPLKKASGDGLSPDTLEDIILRNTSENY